MEPHKDFTMTEPETASNHNSTMTQTNMETFIAVAAVTFVLAIVSTVLAVVLSARESGDDVMQQVIGDAPHIDNQV
jgi:hypothetical protein